MTAPQHYKIFFIFAVLFQSLLASAQGLPPELINQFESEFNELLIDVRGSRGGNGDVAAGYLTIMEWIAHHDIKITITVLVDQESRKILNRLAQGNSIFWDKVNVETLSSLPRNKVFDFYLALASPSGNFRYGRQLDDRHKAKQRPDGPRATSPTVTGTGQHNAATKKITVDTDAVLIVQTVLGNTENFRPINPNAFVRHSGVNYDMSPAGLGTNEAGIYNDYIASNLREADTSSVRDFISSSADLIEQDSSRKAILDIIQQRTLLGAKVGLAYGISASQTKVQFISYLQGLAQQGDNSYVLITPSSFHAKDLRDRDLKRRVVVLSSSNKLPKHAERGKIYVVKTATLPHSVFVGLMAYSMRQGVPPIGAGDGFMSAAINLGEAFGLTRVAWNAKNIKNLLNKLLKEAAQKYGEGTEQYQATEKLLKEVFEQIDFRHILKLARESSPFDNVRQQIPSLSERVLNAAVAIREVSRQQSQCGAACEAISDKTLRKSAESGGKIGEILMPHVFVSGFITNSYIKSIKTASTGYGPSISSDHPFVELWARLVNKLGTFLADRGLNTWADMVFVFAPQKPKPPLWHYKVFQANSAKLGKFVQTPQSVPPDTLPRQMIKIWQLMLHSHPTHLSGNGASQSCRNALLRL